VGGAKTSAESRPNVEREQAEDRATAGPLGRTVIAMATIEHETESEYDPVFDWRLDVLQRAGYPPTDAWLLAGSPEVDLRVAERLLGDGCPSATAMRILV